MRGTNDLDENPGIAERRAIARILSAVVASSLIACSTSVELRSPDAEARVDASFDASADAGPSVDASFDASADAGQSVDSGLDAARDAGPSDAAFDASSLACYPVTVHSTFGASGPPPEPYLVGEYRFCDWIGFSVSASELPAAQALPGVSCSNWASEYRCAAIQSHYGLVTSADYDVICGIEAMFGPRTWWCHIEI